MIEREAPVKISSDLLGNLLGGTKTVSGQLVRVAARGLLRGHAHAAGRQLHHAAARRHDGRSSRRDPSRTCRRSRSSARARGPAMPATLKVAVIGLGPLGQAVARIAAAHPGLKLVAAVDPAPQHAGRTSAPCSACRASCACRSRASPSASCAARAPTSPSSAPPRR